MMKVMRKYNKALLAVFCAFLMIVFIIPSFDELLAPDPTKRVIGEAFGREVTYRDKIPSEIRTSILSSIGLPWQAPWYSFGLPIDAEALTQTEWMLLTEEAERLGVMVSRAEVDDALNRDRDRVDQIKADRSYSEENMRDAVGSYLLVIKAIGSNLRGVDASESQLRATVSDRKSKAKVELVSIPVQGFVDGETPLSDDELQAQFNKYREAKPTDLEYGYVQPDRVRVQYIMADVDKVSELLVIPESEARDYWKKNKTQFTYPPVPPTTQPTTQPETQPKQGPYETFVEAKEQVYQRLKKLKAAEEAEKTLRTLALALYEPWFDEQTEPGKYAKLPNPAIAEADYYEKTIEKLRDRLKYAEALTVATTELFGPAEKDKAGVLSQASLPSAEGQPMYLTDVAFRTEGLVDKPAEPTADAAIYLARYRTAPGVFKRSNAALYLFRVIEVRKSHIPATLEECRAQVEADVRESKAIEQVKELAAGLIDTAEQKGLKQAYEETEAIKSVCEQDAYKGQNGYAGPPPFTQYMDFGAGGGGRQFPSFLPKVGSNEAFVNRVFELARKESPDHGFQTQMIPKPKRYVVWRLETVEPVPIDVYEQSREQVMTQIRRDLYTAALTDWCRRDNIHARTNFKPRLE